MSGIHGWERPTDSASLDALTHPRRCRIVDALRGDGAHDVGELATRVTAWEQDERPESVDENTRQRTMVELLHVDLPVLADADLVAYDPAERTVRPGDEAESEDGSVSADLPPAVIDALADERRRRTLAVLNDRATPLSVTDLACELASAELDTTRGEVPEDYRHSVHVALHHCHLPKLADAGLVLYDEAAHEVERSARLLEPIAELIQPDDCPSRVSDHGHRPRGG